MYQGMTEKHINFDLSKTDNVDADVNQVNEQNILCNFCGTLLIEHGIAVKQSHHVSYIYSFTTIRLFLKFEIFL